MNVTNSLHGNSYNEFQKLNASRQTEVQDDSHSALVSTEESILEPHTDLMPVLCVEGGEHLVYRRQLMA